MTSQIIYKGSLRTEATHLQSGTVIETDAPTDNQGHGDRFLLPPARHFTLKLHAYHHGY